MEEIRIIIDRNDDKVNEEFIKNKLSHNKLSCIVILIYLLIFSLWCITSTFGDSSRSSVDIIRLVCGLVLISVTCIAMWGVGSSNKTGLYIKEDFL